MAIIKTGTFTVTSGGTAQNLTLGFTPSYFKAWNNTIIAAPANTKIAMFEWSDSMANASADVYTYNATPIQVLTRITTNGVTPFTTAGSALWTPTNITITGISKAASAVVTATNTLVAGDIVTFHGIVGMTQMNTLTGTVLSSNGSTFTVNINSTSFTTYGSGGIANLISNTQQNVGVMGVTLGTTLMATTSDSWRYIAMLDTPVTS